MIHLNNTEARQKVEPLNTYHIEKSVAIINSKEFHSDEEKYVLQNLIDSYQNLQHFWDVVGGWEGYNKLKPK